MFEYVELSKNIFIIYRFKFLFLRERLRCLLSTWKYCSVCPPVCIYSMTLLSHNSSNNNCRYPLQFLPQSIIKRPRTKRGSCHSTPTTCDVILVPKDIAVFFQGLFKGAGIVLKPQGLLLTYGVSKRNISCCRKHTLTTFMTSNYHI